MKSRLLIIIAAFLVLIPWIKGLEFGMNNQVMADGITVSAIIVMTITIAFSLVSWFLFSWASKNIQLTGFLLSVIAGASLVIPFLQVLGPMAGVIVGIVAGFAAFMLQSKMTNPVQNKSLVIATITIVATYFVLSLMILTAQSVHVWDTGDGIGEWTGTADMMIEEKGFDNIFNNNIGFIFFLIIIPSLIITGLIIRDKKKIKIDILMTVGIALMIEGFLATFYTSFFLFPPTTPPMMRPLGDIDYVFYMYRQAFLLSGIIGIFVTLAGIIFWRKRK